MNKVNTLDLEKLSTEELQNLLYKIYGEFRLSL